MQLLLVRHAIAFDRNASRWPDDAERPLTRAGAARARQAAQALKRLGEPPVRVLTSSLTRAQQTASILTRFAGWPEATPCAQLLPGVSPERVIGLLARARDRCVAVVGHEPGLSRLIAACLPGGASASAFEMKKMGVALLEFPAAAQAGRGRLVWLLPPKVLRAAR